MTVGRTLRPLYVGVVGTALAAALAFGAASMCVRGAPVVAPGPYNPPAVTAPAPSPMPSGLEGMVTATPAPTATNAPVGEPTPPATATPPKPPYTPPPTPPTTTPPPTATPSPIPPPTPAQHPPTPAATTTVTPTLTLEERAQAVVDKYRNDTTTVITDYKTIEPIVQAVLKDSGLKYDNLIPQIWAAERFNRFYCENDLKCVEALNKDSDQGLAFVSGQFVIAREGQFYQVITSALRETLLGIAFNNYNAKSERTAEIAGYLGFSFAKPRLAEMFGYDPHNNVADTPENRAKTAVPFTGGETDLWIRAAWLINESRGHLYRSKPERPLMATQALDAFIFFVNLPNPDQYVTDLAAKNDLQKDDEWVTEALQARLKPSKPPTDMDKTVLAGPLFYLP